MRLIRFAALTFLSAGFIHAQLPASKPAAFKASLLQFQKQSADWRRALTIVKVEDLPITYAEGKAIQQNIDVALGDLDLAFKQSEIILRSPSLDIEITLMATIQNFNSQMMEVANLLVDINVNDKATVDKILGWNETLTGFASGGVNALFTETFNYVTARAHEIEAKNCPTTQ